MVQVKVVVAHNRYSSAQPSGENIVVDSEIAQLTGAGVTVVPFLRSSDEIADLGPVGKLALMGSPVYSRSTQRELSAMLERERPDVLHLHNPYPFLSPAVVRTAQRHGVPVVQTVHNYRQVCVNGLYFRDGHLCHDCRGRMVGLPGVLHGCYRGSKAQSAVMATALAVNRGTWRRLDRYIALTEAVADHLRGFGVSDDRITVKPNGVPDPGEPAPPGDGFVYVGRLSDEKGVSLLLDAWERHPDGALGRLAVAGDGPLRAAVAAAAARRGDIEYFGQVTPAERDDLLRAAAALVTASVCEDVLPTVVIEAMAHGRPVLTTDLGGPPSMVADTGVVVAPTVEALADGLARMRVAAAELSGRARQRYLSHFTPEVVLSRQLEIYRELSENGRS